MRTSPKQANRMFRELAADLSKARPDLIDTVKCPLCLGDFGVDSIRQLSVEHPVPSTLGGTTTTLTCRKCNNSQGTRLDRHLVSAMTAMDALEGNAPISMAWHNEGGRIGGNLVWKKSGERPHVSMNIVGKTSNPAAIQAIRSQLFDGATLNMTLNFEFIPERYWRAAIRAAYLSVFCTNGYSYILSEGAAQVRPILNEAAPARDRAVMEAFPHSAPTTDALVMPATLGGLGDFFVVLLRLQSERIRYLAVLLPGMEGCDWDILTTINTDPSRLRLETTPANWTSRLVIDLGNDPVTTMRINPKTRP